MYMYIHVYTCTYMYIHVHTCTYMYMYMYNTYDIALCILMYST